MNEKELTKEEIIEAIKILKLLCCDICKTENLYCRFDLCPTWIQIERMESELKNK